MLNKKTYHLLTTLFSMGITPGLVTAAEPTEALNVAKAEEYVSQLEIGLDYVANDSYRFGRYNGMIDQGPYIIGNINAKSYDDEAGFWKLRGTNLGLDSRYLRLDAGVQGSQQFFIEYDQLPDFENDTGTTPFVNPGSTNLILPAGYDFNNLDAFLLPFDQETERKRLGLGGKLHLKSRWELAGSISRETKSGTDWIGAAMGPTTENNIFRFTNGALLPEPIDYKTDKIDAVLTYHGKETQLEFAYTGSLFYNEDTSLSWTDPLPNPDTTSTETQRPGRISLEPDNQKHQLTAVLGHVLSPANRLTALASASLLTQDKNFLPYSVSDTVDSLPQESLDGEVWLYRGQLKLTSRPARKLRLSAQYKYDERDNETDRNSYTYILADGVDGLPDINPRSNDPLSYRKQMVDLTANYRFNSKMSLRGGYQYDQIKRDHDDDQVKTTRRNTLLARFKVKPISQLKFDIYGEFGKRKGSFYRTRAFENEDLRVSYLADLDREKVGTSINYMPTNRLNFGLTAEYLNDDYTESEIGLKESTQKSALFNANYLVTENINTHAFYNYREFKSNNANENKEVEKGTFDVWQADLKDRINSLGLGLSINGLAEKWDAGIDWVYTRSNGRIDMMGSQAPVDLAGNVTGAFVPIETEQFPDVKTKLNSLQLWALYKYSDNIAYKLRYWYEHYNTEDWAVDGTVNNYLPLENDTISQFLFLGEDTLNYTQHVVGLSVHVRL